MTERVVLKAHCTCYLGRLCMSTHKSWEEFERTRDPDIDRQLEHVRQVLAERGFNASPGPDSTYSQLLGGKIWMEDLKRKMEKANEES